MRSPENFKRYAHPKKAVFAASNTANEYNDGWPDDLQELDIIGENSTSYVYKLIVSEQGQWEGNKVKKVKSIVPIGIHKSRLVRWTVGQLALFD